MKLSLIDFIFNRFALIEHRNRIDAQRNLTAFLDSSPSTTIFAGVQASYARENKLKSSSTLKPKFMPNSTGIILTETHLY